MLLKYRMRSGHEVGEDLLAFVDTHPIELNTERAVQDLTQDWWLMLDERKETLSLSAYGIVVSLGTRPRPVVAPI